MPSTTARVPTANASRYLQQLCKHWAHKLEVSFTPEHGEVKLPDGALATMDAAPEALDVRIEAGDAEVLERMKDVVARHLDRFAFREAPLPFDWRDAA
ncbi:DUF2218 domain-containing protein [Starkeya sp. 3C]|uniref:DUF2218 domain-containing protein n=1 Tax=Ancylobacter moscoviensis TaxID=2597768 RepID=A0ABY3DPL0_9HYPH|nr:DUF2218 domain-containing protein [Ancylobacter moscoviensis]TSJ61542.1 DUF2218 domain-containing protein [Ancylobacter moscoviensis]